MVSRTQIQQKHRAVHKDAYRYWLGVGLLAGGLSAAITVGAGVAAADSDSGRGGSDSSSARDSKADRATKSESRQSVRERGPQVRAERRTEARPTERIRRKLSAAKADRDMTRDTERNAVRRDARRQWAKTREVAAEAPTEVPRSVRSRQARAVEARTVEAKAVETRAVETRDVRTVTAPAALTKVQERVEAKVAKAKVTDVKVVDAEVAEARTQERIQAKFQTRIQATIQERIQPQVQPRAATVLQSRLQAQRVRLGEQLRAHLANLRDRLRAGIFNPVKPVPAPPVSAPPVTTPPAGTPPEATPPEVVTPKPPTLIWESNFDNLDDAQRHWGLQSGRWGEPGGENQYYTADGSNVWVDDGVLVIEARRETPPDGRGAPDNYTSARVVTYEKVSVEANSRIVARIKMPYTEGTLPAFWMVGEEPGHHFDWPRQGEIDIVEVPGLGTAEGSRMWHGNIHGPAQTDNTTDIKLEGIQQDLGVDLSADFHEYGIDWYSDKIVWHVDGVQTGQITRAEYEAMGGDWTPFSGAWPHYLIMNVAVGNPWTGDPDPAEPFAPQQMQVDWVRVYQLDAV